MDVTETKNTGSPAKDGVSFGFETCRNARVNRDRRYDGLFYSAAATTKVYCRSICPGKPPLVSNTVFFKTREEAESAGFRPCLRCRPELAPGSAIQNTILSQDSRPHDYNHRTLSLEEEGDGGAGQTNWTRYQVGFAKILLTDTDLPLKLISRICRFENSQKMMHVLSNLYHRDPRTFRKPLPVESHAGLSSCALILSYRRPFDWSVLLDYFRARAVRRMESVADDVYQRSFDLGRHQGWLCLEHMPGKNAVRLEVHATDLICLMQVVWRVRRMLGLDADPMALEAIFREDPLLGDVWLRYPGLRVPVAWDAFELAVRAVVGQVISVTAATGLVGRIVETFGTRLSVPGPKGIEKVFPGPANLQKVDLRSCGLTATKAKAIAALARAVTMGELDLTMTVDLDTFIRKCIGLPGIGEWTAQTIAMRGLGHPDAFPAGDLGIVKAMSIAGQPMTATQIRKMADRWRPQRSFAAMLLWKLRHH
jgi:AraC family transcriptional regulator of adaptative response / DNA-3-methyladenine glycosylase II